MEKFSFNLKRQWPYLIFMIPYVIISLVSMFEPGIAQALVYDSQKIMSGEFYRLVTCYFIDYSIFSLVFTPIMSVVIFQFLGMVVSPIKQVIMMLFTIIFSNMILLMFPVGSQISAHTQTGFLFGVFLYVSAITALFLRSEELFARLFLQRIALVCILYTLFTLYTDGVTRLLVLSNILSAFTIIFGLYYFTKPKSGYSL